MEKSVTTPDQYPLTLNALTNACNQKSSRDPVMSLSQGTVQHCVRELEGKHLLRLEENFKRGVEKYSQRFCNTSFSELQFDEAQFAIVCLLLLRGAQTPGELRARSGRLHEFADNQAVVESLDALNELHPDPLVVQLPRTPGRKDSEYMHLFAGAVDVAAHVEQAEASKTYMHLFAGAVDVAAHVEQAEASKTRESPAHSSISELEQRLSALEAEVAELKQLLE
jgi:uncharacterized protein YceH (UPF0502 family)